MTLTFQDVQFALSPTLGPKGNFPRTISASHTEGKFSVNVESHQLVPHSVLFYEEKFWRSISETEGGK